MTVDNSTHMLCTSVVHDRGWGVAWSLGADIHRIWHRSGQPCGQHARPVRKGLRVPRRAGETVQRRWTTPLTRRSGRGASGPSGSSDGVSATRLDSRKKIGLVAEGSR